MTSVYDIPLREIKKSSTLILNSIAINEVFRRLTEKFRELLRVNAHLHLYTAEGMDRMEFVEAESNVYELESEYSPYNDYEDYDDDDNDDNEYTSDTE